MSELQSLAVSFDGRAWQAMDAQGNYLPLPVEDANWLPELPADTRVESLILPLESLLVRSFSLPLPHPRFIDAGVLGQELDERAGEEPERWWLAWRAGKVAGEAGQVAGMVFGMPVAWRLAIESDPRWRDMRVITPDAWVRLQAHVSGLDAAANAGPVAVFDADADGIYIGVWQAGIWRGMRRLNVASGEISQGLADQCLRSLMAMGWQQGQSAIGRLDQHRLDALKLGSWAGNIVAESEGLPGRLQMQDAVGAGAELNFRHGRWAARTGKGWIRPWKRALVLAAGITLIWLMTTMYQIHALNVQADAYRQQIVDAFHQGLPDEKVMIDALAQLRRAAGSNGVVHANLGFWLQQLASINRAYSKEAWDMQELELRDGGIVLAGKAKNLEALNRIRQLLQQESGRDVVLADTDLSGEQVNFRMHWR